jgi:murein L,D-transpeptidase YcbB/YkuD
VPVWHGACNGYDQLRMPDVRRVVAGILTVSLAAVASPAATPQGVDPPALARTVAAIIQASAAERSAVLRLYERRGGRWLWHDAAGRPTAGADAVRELLAGLDSHGLDPGDYRAPALPDALASDIALTVSALRAMHDLHLGRVDPRSLGLRLPTWAEPHDFAAILEAGVAAGTPAAAISGLAPPFALYARLRDALRAYRTLAAAGSLPDLAEPSTSVRPGELYHDRPALGTRLRAFGDLSDGPILGDPDRLDEPVVAALRRFQHRHGLTPDGVLGARTAAALRVEPAARVQQIVLALERLRWLPDLGTRPLIAVNIPMFRAWAWDAARDDATPTLAVDVIVGRAVRTQTPVFVDVMERVIFRPYWNVPASILRQEVLPALRRDARYLARQGMEIVQGGGDDARVVPLDAAALDGLAAGWLRVRQRPGPGNALGLVKFLFPNDDAVYMHDTPTRGLFARDRRDFSHGCIRVADPVGLASWVLSRQATPWPATRLADAMAGPDNVAVTLDAPIDVVIFYLTAAVLPEDGLVHFATDLYGHDAVLARALARRRQASPGADAAGVDVDEVRGGVVADAALPQR